MRQVGDALDVTVDFLGDRRLLLGRRRHLGIHVADLFHLRGDGAKRLAGALAGGDAGAGCRLPGLHRTDRRFRALLEALDHLPDLVGRALGTAGQGAHFVGDHGEAAAHLPGARRLDGGIQRQQVGLFGNTANYRQHLVDGRHLLRQLAHRSRRAANLGGHLLDMLDRLTDHLTRLLRLVTRAVRGLRGAARVTGDLLHGEAHFMHGGGDHVGHFLLLASPPGGVLHHLRNLTDRVVQPLAGGQHRSDQVALTADKAVEATRQIAQLIGARLVQTATQVAAATADLEQRRGHLANRPHQTACQQHHQAEKQQRHAEAAQTGQPQRLPRLGIDLRLRHLADQQPVQAGEFLRHRQVDLPVAFEAHRGAGAAEQFLRRALAKQLAQMRAAVQLGLRVNLDRALAIDQEHPALGAETKVADHLRHGLQAVTQPGNTKGLTIALDPLIDEQGWLAGGLVDIDFQRAVAVAVDQRVEPLVFRLIALEGAQQPVTGGVGAAVQRDNRGGQGILLGAHAFQVTGELAAPGIVLPRRQPILNQAVFGDAGIRGDRRGKHPLQVIADRQHPRRQRLLHQIALGQAIDQRRIDAHHDQDAGEQRRAHAEDQLPLNTALPEVHGKPAVVIVVSSRTN